MKDEKYYLCLLMGMFIVGILAVVGLAMWGSNL